MTPEQPSSTRCMPSRSMMVNLCLPAARVIILVTIALGRGLHTGGWGSAPVLLSQELWTDLAVAVLFSAVSRGDEEVRINRLRRPAAHASRHLRLVHPRLLYSSRSPYALFLLLYSTNLASCCFPELCSLLCSFHCVPLPCFFADVCTYRPSWPSLSIPRCARRLPCMRVHCAHLHLPARRVLSSSVNSGSNAAG